MREADASAARVAPAACGDAAPFALRVTDASMAPEFPPGCVVVVDPTGHARAGAFVVAEHAGAPILRRLAGGEEGGGWRLEPLDAAFPTLALGDGLEAVRGVVVQRAGRGRRDRRHYD